MEVTDPYTGCVGLQTVEDTLHEHTEQVKELKKDGEGRPKLQCPCDVARHPPYWTSHIITAVHDYSYLLHRQDLKIPRDWVMERNPTNTVVIFNVRMGEDYNPWKLKAEEVIRFMDIELGIGDQKHENSFHYKQPLDRMIILAVSQDKVLGLIVAEKVEWANRILSQTQKYQDLEEKQVPVRLGVNRLWVHVSVRRRGLATCLCLLVKCNFYDDELELKDFAFNMKSDQGVAFAKMFLKTHAVPIYIGDTGMNISDKKPLDSPNVE